jgi:hypothetical protein
LEALLFVLLSTIPFAINILLVWLYFILTFVIYFLLYYRTYLQLIFQIFHISMYYSFAFNCPFVNQFLLYCFVYHNTRCKLSIKHDSHLAPSLLSINYFFGTLNWFY